MTTVFRLLLASAAISLAAPAAFSQSCPQEPSFAGVSSANPNTRGGARSVERGEWFQAAVFSRNALNSGASSRHKSVAAVNLCAALGAQGDDGALAACNDAVERNEGSWEALVNRGGAFWVAGDHAAARADFERAGALAADEEAVIANLALARCAH